MMPLPWLRSIPLLLALCCALASLAFGTGCSNKGKKKTILERNAASVAREESLILQESQGPTVYVRGAVQRPIIPWRENMTLADALLDAGYNSAATPRAIRIRRADEIYEVNIRLLLRDRDNPLIEPRDLIEVIR